MKTLSLSALAFGALLACAPQPAPTDHVAPADTAEPEVLCDDGAPPVPWDASGADSTLRHSLAADFSVPLTDGTTWTLSEHWTGCESFVFIPDSLVNSELDPTSIWARDVDGLIAASPRDAHYFFVSTQKNEAA